MSKQMTYVDYGAGGGSESLFLARREVEQPRGSQVLVRVEYAGVNRPDVMQRSGSYPPPPNASPYLGLEISGTVEAVGADVQGVAPGQEVCALTPGGGYAEYCIVDSGQCLRFPHGMAARSACAIPENYFTVWENLFNRAHARKGELLLVHGGSSGIGLTAIQLAKAWNINVWATVGNTEKAAACRRAGADHVIIYKDEDFTSVIKRDTDGHGVDVVLDMVGGDYIPRNIDALATEGRLVQIAFLQGSIYNVDFMPIMTKRLTVTGSTLRPRTNAYKHKIAMSLLENVFPLMDKGLCCPVICAEFSLKDVKKAHDLMESSSHIGKIVLKVG